ncbi:DNA cytosine methyltransferase [Lysinibacillus sp. NPDC096418]|uniref:DNA cytosine methyltransferase n=1 Tax=Lysinibacillus sp. NPDC096418 TaxID=3364138 RepID=UPI00382BEA64
MKFLDLFAGIGGFRLGMEAAGHECVGYVEIDKFARKSYEAIHNTEGEWTAHDITSVTDDTIRGIGSIDIICGGFPCQAFSVAGKRKGFNDTRGTLFFEIMRFASILRPRYLFLENVTGLLNHEGGDTFETIIRTLDEVGYDAEWDCINSKEYVPQNRERVFIVGHSRESSTRKVFPIGEASGPVDESRITTGTLTARYPESQREGTYIETYGKAGAINLVGNINPSGNGMNGQVFSSDGLSPTLTTNKGEGLKIVQPVLTPDRVEKSQNGRRVKDVGEPMFTLTAQDRHGIAIKEATLQGFDTAYPGDSINYSVPTSETRRGRVGKGIANTLDTGCQQGVLTEEYRIRKLTPRECWRLQGFPDWAFDRAAEVNSDSQLYKQAGNSVTVNVIEAIANELYCTF